MIRVYTDGACSHRNGGWAWIAPDEDRSDSGAVPDTTNNRMELLAVIEALRAFAPWHDLEIVSDSAYVVNCLNEGWWKRWAVNGWRTSAKKPVENQDLWIQLLQAVRDHTGQLKWTHVRGHGKRATDDPVHVAGNDQADRLAVAARLTLVEA